MDGFQKNRPDDRTLFGWEPAPNSLAWVDEFIRNVSPYIFVRLEDNLLIKRPNQAVKLNPTGTRILYELIQGKSIAHLLKELNADTTRTKEITSFLLAVKEHLEGKLNEFSFNPAIETIPLPLNFSPYPVLSEIAITYRCNAKCRFCYAGCNHNSKKESLDFHHFQSSPASSPSQQTEMTLSEAKQILDKIYKQALVPSVSFTGGEPLLVPWLPQAITHAKELGMRVNLITNGTLLTEKMAKQLASAGLDSAQVSLEGVTPSTHDAIVQMKGAFELTIAAVHFLKKAGIHTHTNTTLNSENLHESTAIPQFVKQVLQNDKFSMNLVIPAGTSSHNESLLIKYSRVAPHLEKIIAASHQANIEFMWYSPVPMCMFNSILHNLGNKGCSTCDGLISIAPNGDVLPCASYPQPVGNLLHQDFNEIWQSKQARMFRDKTLAHPFCRECEHFTICNGACPLYWQHMGFEELTSLFETKNQSAATVSIAANI